MNKPTITLYNMDCLELMRTMPDKSVDLVLTDPPYGINYQSNMRVCVEKFAKLKNDNNDMRFVAYPELHRALRDDCVVIVFCSFKNYAEDYNELTKLFDIKNCIVWDKGGGGIGDLTHSLSTDYELAIVAHKGDCEIRGKRDGSVWKYRKVNPIDMLHPTQKPVDLLAKAIEKYSDNNDTVFDPFMGSGTTGVACKLLRRNFIGCEISKQYFDLAKRRIDSTEWGMFE
jgi:site-specific DNA-methyltransferase (adenine-specific)